jgi:hypothetical protein
VALTLGNAAFEALADFIFGQIASDKYNAAVAKLVGPPWALMIAVEDHVDTLEDEPFGVVLERQDAFAAKNILAFGRHQILHPGKEFVGVQRLVTPKRHAPHIFVMIVLEPVAMMVVIVAVVMMMIVVVVMVVAVVGL